MRERRTKTDSGTIVECAPSPAFWVVGQRVAVGCGTGTIQSHQAVSLSPQHLAPRALRSALQR